MKTWTTIAMLALTGCGASLPNQIARDDLQCPGTLDFAHMNDGSVIASGCDKEAKYVEVCDAKQEQCHWVRDSEVRRKHI